MNILLIFLSIILLLLIGIAFLRLRIIIDTEMERFEMQLIPIGSARLLIGDGTIGYQLNVPFVHREGQLFPPEEQLLTNGDRPRTIRSSSTNRRSRLSIGKTIRMGSALIKSFKVNRFHLRLDTGDPIWNAWLFPAFALWRSRGADVAVQFVGGTTLSLDIENSVHRMAGALIRSFITKT